MQTIYQTQIHYQIAGDFFFDGLNEDQKTVDKNLNGPSWSQKKRRKPLNKKIQKQKETSS